jgi:hypothetical protein
MQVHQAVTEDDCKNLLQVYGDATMKAQQGSCGALAQRQILQQPAHNKAEV